MQVVFVPVDVRNFVQNGLMVHSYPVNTGVDKLKQYFADASPLVLSLYIDSDREAAGKAFLILSSEHLEGYFPVLNNDQDEVATIHVKIDYIDNMKKTESKTSVKKVDRKLKPKPTRVTFPTHIEQLSFSCDSGSSKYKQPKLPQWKKINNSDSLQMSRNEENLSILSAISNSSQFTSDNVKNSLDTITLAISLTRFSVKGVIFKKLREVHSKQKSNRSKQSLPKIFLFVKLNIPGVKETTFCTRVNENDTVAFPETKILEDIPYDVTLWNESDVKLNISCRVMGCKDTFHVGTTTIPLNHFKLRGHSSSSSPVVATILTDKRIFSQLGLKPSQSEKVVGNFSISMVETSSVKQLNITSKENDSTIKDTSDIDNTPRQPIQPHQKIPTLKENDMRRVMTNINANISRNLPKPKPLKNMEIQTEPSKPHKTLTNQSSSVVKVSSPVYILLSVTCEDVGMAQWANIRIKWWTGRQSSGLGYLQCSELLLQPGHEGRYYNRQSLSSILDNYLVLELWRHDKIVGIARVPTHAVHSACQSWRGDGVICFNDRVQVISVINGNVIGQFKVNLSMGYDHKLPANVRYDNDNIDLDDPASDIEDDTLNFVGEEEVEESPPDIEPQRLMEEENLVEKNPDNDNYDAIVNLEEVRLSVSNGWVYCSFPDGAKSPCQRSENSVWSSSVKTQLPSLARCDQSQLILRLWYAAEDGRPDSESDKMFGFVSVDCSPLQLGFPTISGWYNIIDWVGKNKGQMKITVRPRTSKTDTDLTSKYEAVDNLSRALKDIWNVPSQRIFDNSDDAVDTLDNKVDNVLQTHISVDQTKQTPAATEESLSFMEFTLSKHLNDLNHLTTKLGRLLHSKLIFN